MLLIFYYVRMKYIKNKNYDYLKIVSISLNALILLSLVLLVWSYRYIFLPSELIFISFAMLVSVILNVYLSLRVLNDREIKKMIQQFEAYEGTLLPLVDEIRAAQHDFKNHLNTLEGVSLLENCEAVEEVRQEINSYISGLNSGQQEELTDILQINNKIIGAILYSKACQAKVNNVNFYRDIPPYQVQIPLKSYEYISVLNTLFDNAFECVQNQEALKEIVFRLDYDKGKPYFEVGNNGSQQVDGYKHIKNITKVVRKYNGKVVVLNQEHRAVFRIQFE